jgi:hypothetical protein
MTPLKLPSNFKYKALFGSRFLASSLKPFVFKSLPFEALNNLHAHFDPKGVLMLLHKKNF